MSRKSKIEAIHQQEAEALKKLFIERAGVSQAAFGEQHGLGNQANVGFYLNAKVPDKGNPLNLEAAIKFAKGLGCAVSEFSPRLSMVLFEAQAREGLGVKNGIPASQQERVLALFDEMDPIQQENWLSIGEIFARSDKSGRSQETSKKFKPIDVNSGVMGSLGKPLQNSSDKENSK